MDQNIQQAVAEFLKGIEHLRREFAKLQIGRANPVLVEDILIEAYGTRQPLKTLAAVTVPEATTLQVQPWDRGTLGALETGIKNSNFGLNPINNGTVLIIKMPPLTEERRRELVKLVSQLAEKSRIAVRTARGDSHSKIKQLEHDKQLTEDDRRQLEKKLQEEVDKANGEIEKLSKAKEAEILKI